MSKIVEWMDLKLYADYSDNWDDSFFRENLLRLVDLDSRCLDFGAGRGNVEHMNFKTIAGFVAGVDPDEEVLNNPFLNDAKVIDPHTNLVPYDDNSFDVVFSDNVMEHIQDPETVFQEIYRVLKPGGVFIAKTPNKWHYMPCIARVTPLWFHRFYNELRGRKEFDTFPTAYKCNSMSAIKKFAKGSSFHIKNVEYLEGRPEYLRLTAITYLFGYMYERFVNSNDLLRYFRSVIIFRLVK